MKEMSYVLTKGFAACVPVRFFSLRRLFSPCCPLAFLIFSPPIFMFFFQQNSSPLFFSSFSVIHVSKDIKI